MIINQRKPNLFIPGAGKSGTSSLHNYLGQHPDIEMSKIKEPHFFCQADYHLHWNQYLNLFDQHKNVKYRGESSTGYMVFPNAIKRIIQQTQDPKFIFILRNPIDRAYSHYHWLKAEGFEPNDFHQAILKDQNQPPVFGHVSGIGYKSYFQWGCYGKWIGKYLRAIDVSHIHLITTESLAKNFQAVMNGCFQFLELSSHPIRFSKKLNQTYHPTYPNFYYALRYYSILNLPLMGLLYHYFLPRQVRTILKKTRYGVASKYKQLHGHRYQPLSVTDRNWLRREYKQDVEHLRQLTGKSFSEWLDFN